MVPRKPSFLLHFKSMIFALLCSQQEQPDSIVQISTAFPNCPMPATPHPPVFPSTGFCSSRHCCSMAGCCAASGVPVGIRLPTPTTGAASRHSWPRLSYAGFLWKQTLRQRFMCRILSGVLSENKVPGACEGRRVVQGSSLTTMQLLHRPQPIL